MTYEVHAANAISETLDGETIVINMNSGSYYSMNESGSLVWDSIVAKQGLEAIVAKLAARYAADSAVIKQSVSTLLETLEKDGLIVQAADSAAASTDDFNGEKKAFVAPAITKYDDMQEMLLADPIHDVDEMGWPTLKK